jgi:calcineurin-like phosphoesterase family protein
MNTWFTADLHLGHANIIKFCERPYLSPAEAAALAGDPRGDFPVSDETVARHDAALIDNINEVVARQDQLYVLGDFCLGRLDQVAAYLSRIRCRHVCLVRGNHDRRSALPAFHRVMEQGLIKVRGQKIFLNHFPMRSWQAFIHGSWHLYGHVHGHLRAEDEANDWMLVKDVGVDANNYRPLSFDEVAAYMAPRAEKFQQRKIRFFTDADLEYGDMKPGEDENGA